jgi:O-antigen/teichoic acid export membrane protein
VLLRTLASDTAIYGLGAAAAQVAAILAVPVYANVLGSVGTGTTTVGSAILAAASMLVGLALPQAFLRWYLHEAHTLRNRSEVLATTVTLRVVTSIVGAGIVAALAVPLSLAMFGSTDLAPAFVVIAFIVLVDSFTTIPLSVLRAERRPAGYIVISLTRALVGLAATVVFVVVVDAGVVGVFYGSLSGALAAFPLGLVTLVRAGALRPRWDGALARSMLAFSLPLVPTAIAGWTLNLADRPLLQLITRDESLVGIYGVGYTAGLAINALVIQPFTLAWGAAYWELSYRGDAPTAFARVLTAFAAAAGLVALGLAALGTDVIRFLLRPEFEPARFIIPFSAFAFVLYGIFNIVSAGLNIAGQTRRLPAVMAGAAAVNIALNLILIPVIGLYGAALATVVSYGVLALLAERASQRHYPVPWDFRRVGIALGSAALLAAAALLGPDHVLWRLAAIAVYAPLLIGTGVVGRHHLATFGGILRDRRRA